MAIQIPYTDGFIQEPSASNAESKANKGAPNGYAPLDGNAKVPSANLPVVDVSGQIATHNSATTSVHGIANTANLSLVGHAHAISDVTNLQTTLDTKSPLAGVQWTARHTTSTGNPYVVGSIVYHNGRVYRCLAENDSMEPGGIDNPYWADLGVGYLLPNENPLIEGGTINTRTFVYPDETAGVVLGGQFLPRDSTFNNKPRYQYTSELRIIFAGGSWLLDSEGEIIATAVAGDEPYPWLATWPSGTSVSKQSARSGGNINASGGQNGAGGSINTSNDGGSINTTGGANGAGGSINTSAGNGAGGSINTTDSGGSINTSFFGGSVDLGSYGGNINSHGVDGDKRGGSITLNSIFAYPWRSSGSINLSAGTYGDGGSIISTGGGNDIGGNVAGGTLNMSAGDNGVGGSINTSNGGGSINTAGSVNDGGDRFSGGLINTSASLFADGGYINTSAVEGGNGGNIDTRGEGANGYSGGSILTKANEGGAGGSINTSGGDEGAGGSINTSGGSEGDGGSINTSDGGGSINTMGGDAGSGGSINTSAGDSDGGGYIYTYGEDGVGGNIDTHGEEVAGGYIYTFASGSSTGGYINTSGSTGTGGNIDTSSGGGSINTRGTGSIELGVTGTRTTLNGSASGSNKTITLPNATGTIALTNDVRFGSQTIFTLGGEAKTTFALGTSYLYGCMPTRGPMVSGSYFNAVLRILGHFTVTGISINQYLPSATGATLTYQLVRVTGASTVEALGLAIVVAGNNNLTTSASSISASLNSGDQIGLMLTLGANGTVPSNAAATTILANIYCVPR